MLLSAWSPDVSNDIMKIRHHIVAPATAWCRTIKWWKISIFRGRLFEIILDKNGYFPPNKTDIFTSNWCEMDIFHANMRPKRIFSENIPLLIAEGPENHEKYMFRPGS